MKTMLSHLHFALVIVALSGCDLAPTRCCYELLNNDGYIACPDYSNTNCDLVNKERQ